MTIKIIKTVTIASILAITFLASCKKDDIPQNPVRDIEGNVYKTVTIGKQVWMAENLKTTKYNNGTTIPNVTNATAWSELYTGALCNYNNTTNADTINTYGRLYNWYAVNTGKLCPTGWHVPTDAEWTTLINYLGGENIAGGKLKEISITHWSGPNTGATNETGFTALPGGYRSNFSDDFNHIGYGGYWWSATTEYSTDFVWCREIFYYYNTVDRYYQNKKYGFSVRCLKD